MLLDRRGTWKRHDAKPTVESALSLDISELARKLPLDKRGRITWFWEWGLGWRTSVDIVVAPGEGLLLWYSPHEKPIKVEITYTTPHLGGRRPWFRCPCCNRRVRILYHVGRFWCRTCSGLTYQSCQQGRPSKSWQRIMAMGDAEFSYWLEDEVSRLHA